MKQKSWISVGVLFILLTLLYLSINGVAVEVASNGGVSYWRKYGVGFILAPHSTAEEWITCRGQKYREPEGCGPTYFLSTADGEITLFCSKIDQRNVLHINWNKGERPVLTIPMDTDNGLAVVLGRHDPADYCEIEAWDGVILKIKVAESVSRINATITIDTSKGKMNTVPFHPSVGDRTTTQAAEKLCVDKGREHRLQARATLGSP